MEAAQEEKFASLLRKQIGESKVNATNFIAFFSKTIFLKTKAIDWKAKVWYVKKLNMSPERYSLGSTIVSFSFLDIRPEDNRKMLQEYMKYLFTVTNLNLGTIRIKQTYIKEFLKYLEKQEKAITTIDTNSVKEYFEQLSIQRISPQSYNNRIQTVTIFLQYLQMKDYIKHFTISVFFYKKKSYPKNHEVRDLDKKLDLLTLHLSDNPKKAICMFVKKGRL